MGVCSCMQRYQNALKARDHHFWCNNECFQLHDCVCKRSRQVAHAARHTSSAKPRCCSPTNPLGRGPVTAETGMTNDRKPLYLARPRIRPRGFGGSSAAARALGAAKRPAPTLLRDHQGRARRARRAARRPRSGAQQIEPATNTQRQSQDGNSKKDGPDGQALPLQYQL